MEHKFKTFIKILAVIALALWLASVSMAYINTWVKTETTSLSVHNEWYWGDSLGNGSITINPVITNDIVDVFPHAQLTSTMWITVLLAIILTVTSLGLWVSYEEN